MLIAFIKPANQYYRHKNFPSYWYWLEGHIDDDIFITSNILAELNSLDDELSEWITGIPNLVCANPARDQEVILKYAEVMQFLNESEHYTVVSMRLWADGNKADPWIIAYASAHNLIVVTEEKGNLSGIIHSGNPTKK